MNKILHNFCYLCSWHDKNNIKLFPDIYYPPQKNWRKRLQNYENVWKPREKSFRFRKISRWDDVGGWKRRENKNSKLEERKALLKGGSRIRCSPKKQFILLHTAVVFFAGVEQRNLCWKHIFTFPFLPCFLHMKLHTYLCSHYYLWSRYAVIFFSLGSILLLNCPHFSSRSCSVNISLRAFKIHFRLDGQQ